MTRNLETTRLFKAVQDADLFDDIRPVDPFDFNFMKVSRRVCLIRRNDSPESTGFLVGPDLMLTTAHSMMGTAGIFADPAEVTVLFDQFIWDHENQTVAHGTSCGLRYIPFLRQPDVVASSIEVDPMSQREINDNELDYVLVRLDRPVGLEFLPYSHRIRGWNDVSLAEIPAEGSVFVVQHPLGGLQKFAEGMISGRLPRDFRKFFLYATHTLNGSSGSPIYDEQRRVVGMHIGETEAGQLGVSFQEIFKDLQEKHVRLPSFPPSSSMMNRLFGFSETEKARKAGNDWRGDRLFDDVAHVDKLSPSAPDLARTVMSYADVARSRD